MKNEKMNNIILNNQINSNIHEDFFKRNGACFLLCVTNQIEEKVISVLGSKYKVLHIGSIEKEEICFKIMILRIYSLDNRSIVTLKINKQNYSLDLNPGINFTFDKSIYYSCVCNIACFVIISIYNNSSTEQQKSQT